MNKKLVIVFILSLFALTIAGNTYAQDKESKKKKHSKKHKQESEGENTEATVHYSKYERREIRRKERAERKKERRERKRKHKHEDDQYVESDSRYHTLPEVTTSSTPTRPVKYPATTMKPQYRIDLLADMYLDELVKSGNVTFKNKIPDKALPGISFYEGVTLAADSLKKAGFNVDIYVHDISSAAESPTELLKRGTLDSADLIIAAIPSASVPDLAAYAKKRKVNFISALSPSDAGVKNNKYFTLMLPTLKTHCEWIADDIVKKFPGMKVSLLYRTTQEADENAYKYITGYNNGNIFLKTQLCNTIPRKADLVNLIDSSRPNVVIVSILDPNAADSVLKELSRSFPATHFEVYGMPSWTVMSSLRKETAFPNLSVNVTSPFNFDASTPIGTYVMHTYKRDYGGKASEYVYRGFETMFWYANLLKQYGTIFNPGYSDNAAAPFTRFEVRARRDNEGHLLYNENTHIFLVKYEGGNSKTE